MKPAPEVLSTAPAAVHKHMTGGFAVTFPTSTVSNYRATYQRLTVHQRIREHDTAVIRVYSKNMDWFRQFSSGTPVQARYWSSNHKDTRGRFVGYVSHVRLVTNEDHGYVRDIICVAASSDLRSTAQTTYRNMTASEIVSQIGAKFGLRVITKQHGLRRATVVQSGETYWELLNTLAKRSGYVLRVDGTTLYFLPLDDMIKATISRAPLLSDYAADINSYFRVPTIEHIDSWVGDVSVDADRASDTAVFTGVAPATGEVFSAAQRPKSSLYRNRESRSKYSRYMDNVAPQSRYDADLLAKGASDEGKMAIEVNLTASGDPSLTPYRPAQLSLKDRSLSGYWLVKEVEHTIIRGNEHRYTCDITLGTDAVDGMRGYRVQQRSPYRNLAPEILLGFSANSSDTSRLASRRDGFLYGTPVDGNVVSRWVHR